MLRLRCRVGHAYTAETLNVALSKSTEDILWASMRALDEKANFLRRMASRSEYRAAAHYEEEAETCQNIRDVLAQQGNSLATTGAE